MTALSISKSVARVFEVLEFFQASHEPCSTPQLERALHYPYSSIRVILKNLSELGYLRYDPEGKTYFPSNKLVGLGNWVQTALLESEALFTLVDSLRKRVDETVALVRPSSIFCDVFKVSNSQRPMALRVYDGIGMTLTHSASGRVLLSQLDAAHVDNVINHTRYWAGSTRAPITVNRELILQALDTVKRQGCLVDYDNFRKDVGTVAYPVTLPGSASAVALFVSGASTDMRWKEVKIRRAIESKLASLQR